MTIKRLLGFLICKHIVYKNDCVAMVCTHNFILDNDLLGDIGHNVHTCPGACSIRTPIAISYAVHNHTVIYLCRIMKLYCWIPIMDNTAIVNKTNAF